MTDAPDWKTKYFTIEQQYKDDQASNEETQQLLCRLIVRLTLAIKGLDPALDPHLDKLRDALKKGINENAQRHMAAISEALMRARDEPVKAAVPARSDAAELMLRLLDHSGLNGRKGKQLKKLGGRIASAPRDAADSDLDEYIQLLARSAQGEKGAGDGGTGLLGRLFSRGDDADATQVDGDEAMRLLLSLLGQLNWPSRLGEDISSLEQRLEQQSREVVVTVVKDLTRIVSGLLTDLNKETRATGSFLADLMARLHELDRYVASGQALQQASLQSGKELDQAMKQQVGDMATSVQDAQDLQVLKQDVASHLETIKGHMDRHLQDAERRFQESQENEERLRERLQEVESETGVLRHKILEAQARSSMDPVTGLSNRAAYDERVQDEYTRWQRFKSPLVLMVWDLDDFKQVNDRFGHQAGDKALRVIGQILKKRLRQTDFVGRYGGEEFCVLLPNTPMDQAALLAEEVRKSVETSGFRSGKKPITLTISCGYSDFRDGDSPDSVFERADRALYQAKGEGKNCCVSG
jgi:diguanylate cyclase